jgi:hypothetical protein
MLMIYALYTLNYFLKYEILIKKLIFVVKCFQIHQEREDMQCSYESTHSL